MGDSISALAALENAVCCIRKCCGGWFAELDNAVWDGLDLKIVVSWAAKSG